MTAQEYEISSAMLLLEAERQLDILKIENEDLKKRLKQVRESLIDATIQIADMKRNFDF
jgi:hypothetical protein